jgi:hypothetical protein
VELFAAAAAALSTGHETEAAGMSQTIWAFRLANSPAEYRRCLILIMTNPRVVPLHVQYVIGHESFSAATFHHLVSECMALNLADLGSIPETSKVYAMVVKLQESIFAYVGSTTGTVPDSQGYILLPKRMRVHRTQLEMEHEDALSAWRPKQGNTLWCHVVATTLGAEVSMGVLLSLPPIEADDITPILKGMILNAEGVLKAGLGCVLGTWNRSLNPAVQRARNLTEFLVRMIQENGLGRGMSGLNMVLPCTQPSSLFGKYRPIPFLPDVQAKDGGRQSTRPKHRRVASKGQEVSKSKEKRDD